MSAQFYKCIFVLCRFCAYMDSYEYSYWCGYYFDCVCLVVAILQHLHG